MLLVLVKASILKPVRNDKNITKGYMILVEESFKV